jgi:EmrB/QacA subfamily drug resistance transporter
MPARHGAHPVMIDLKESGTVALDPRRWIGLLVLLIAPFLSVFDFFVVNISIPAMQRSFQASFAQIQFVVAAYSVAYAVLLVTGGRLGDIYGRKRIFMLGLAGFTLASAICGLSQSIAMIICWRGMQGVGAAMMVPQVLAIMRVTFPVKERGLAFAIFGIALSLAAFLGQLAGGFLLQVDALGLSWRSAFLINLPIGLLALAVAVYALRESASPNPLRLDLGGVAIISLGLLLLIFPLIEGRQSGWPTWSYASLMLAVIILAAFVQYERRVVRRGGSPLVELSIFKESALSVGFFLILFFFAGFSPFFLALTIYLQNGMHFTPLATGYAFSAFALGFLIASTLSIKLAPRLGRTILHLGAGLMALGLIGVIYVIRAQGDYLKVADLWLVLSAYGMGQGFVVPQLFSTIMGGARGSEIGAASGVLSTVQQIASAIGVATIGSVFFGALGNPPQPPDFGGAFTAALRCDVALLTTSFLLVFLLPQNRAASMASATSKTLSESPSS